MTDGEAEAHLWSGPTDGRTQLGLVVPFISRRKLGWFFVACAETVLGRSANPEQLAFFLPRIHDALDGDRPENELRATLRWIADREESELFDLAYVDREPGHPQLDLVTDPKLASGLLSDALPENGQWRWWDSRIDGQEPLGKLVQQLQEDIATEHLPHLRDVFGNPFRPVAFAPAWRTEAVVAISRTMYESRDFAAMPVLADAFDDAGCDHADILAHCRGPGPHVRGCWVVDLVLGKE
jgi:hypothetical protein